MMIRSRRHQTDPPSGKPSGATDGGVRGPSEGLHGTRGLDPGAGDPTQGVEVAGG